MITDYFSFGTTLSGLVNVQTVVTEAPVVLTGEGGRPVPLLGNAESETLSTAMRRDGHANGALVYPSLFQDELNALRLFLFSSYSVDSKRMYVSAIDDTGAYSPFLATVRMAYVGDDYGVTVGLATTSVRIDLLKCILQSVTKATDTTLVATERLIFGATGTGNVALTLPLANAVQANTILRIVKAHASNTLSYLRQSTDTLNLGTSTLTLTANNASVSLVSDGVSNWQTL